jgi:hypothetical protein
MNVPLYGRQSCMSAEILMFLWVMMANQVLYMWMQVIIWMMSVHWRERDWSLPEGGSDQ